MRRQKCLPEAGLDPMIPVALFRWSTHWATPAVLLSNCELEKELLHTFCRIRLVRNMLSWSDIFSCPWAEREKSINKGVCSNTLLSVLRVKFFLHPHCLLVHLLFSVNRTRKSHDALSRKTTLSKLFRPFWKRVYSKRKEFLANTQGRRNVVAATLYRRCWDVVCSLG